ncbi:hypothetical protein ACKRLN_08275 [Anaerococcus sp. DFU013_CI05]|uniref:hypothetical protein n=1 Tax=Anaerococcus sp. AH8042_DFU013_CI05 TaxID=3385202 RepID=UPI003A521643
MQIIDENLKLNKNDSLTHRRFPFKLEENFDRIIIKLSYSPTHVGQGENIEVLEEAVEKYLSDEIYSEEDRKGTLDANIENFLTTSLFYEGKFVGAYHNKVNDQEIVVSREFSSRGYKKFDVRAGSYEFVLSMHSCNSDVDAKISLEAIDE